MNPCLAVTLRHDHHTNRPTRLLRSQARKTPAILWTGRPCRVAIAAVGRSAFCATPRWLETLELVARPLAVIPDPAPLKPAERGVPWCLTAADRAQRPAAFPHAAEHLAAALDLLPRNAPERPRLSARLGLALVRAQRFDTAIGVAREAADQIAETEGADAAADYLAEVVTELNEVGGSFWFTPLVRQGLEYAGEPAEVSWHRPCSVSALSF